VNPVNGAIPRGIQEQAEHSCKNVAEILEVTGTGIEYVIKTTCFLADMNDFAAFNQVYAKFLLESRLGAALP